MKYENISKGAFDAKISDTSSIFFESERGGNEVL